MRKLLIGMAVAICTVATVFAEALMSVDAIGNRVTLPGVSVTSNLTVGGLPAQSNIMAGVGSVWMQGNVYGTNVQASAYLEQSIGGTKKYSTFPYGNDGWKNVFADSGVEAQIAVSRGNQLVTFGGAVQSVLYSSDGGVNWRVLRDVSAQSPGMYGACHVINDTFVYASEHEIFRTTNFFQTFTTNYSNSSYRVFKLCRGEDTTVVASTGYGQLITSTNDGIDWTLLDITPNAGDAENNVPVYAGNKCWVATMCNRLYFSSNNAVTWTNVLDQYGNNAALAAGVNGTVISADGDDDDNFVIYKSSDYGKTWKTVLSTSDSSIIRGVCACYAGNGVFLIGCRASQPNGLPLYQSVDDGETWTLTYLPFTGFGSAIDTIAATKDTVVVGNAQGGAGIFVKSAAFANDLSTGESGLLILKPQAVAPVAVYGGVYMDAAGQHYISTNGTTWQAWTIH